MRELKFRAWDVDRQRFRSGPDNLMLCLNGVKMWQFGYDPPEPADPSAFIIEQFTGLHDKNGTEIYEGDLVNAKYHNLNVFVDGKPRIVHMGYGVDSDGWIHGDWYGWKAGDSSLADVTKECTVIGNIHENPELLDNGG